MKAFVKFAVIITLISTMFMSCTTMAAIQEPVGYFTSQIERDYITGEALWKTVPTRYEYAKGFFISGEKKVRVLKETVSIADTLTDEEYQCLELMRNRSKDNYITIAR